MKYLTRKQSISQIGCTRKEWKKFHKKPGKCKSKRIHIGLSKKD